MPSIDVFPTPGYGGRFGDVLTVFGAVFVGFAVTVRLYLGRRRRKQNEARLSRELGH